MLVPHSRMHEAAEIAAAAAGKVVVGDPGAEGTTIGPAVSEVQFDRIQRLIERGIEEGARLATGGPGRPEGLERGYYVRPTVFSHVSNEMVVAREEIFGPVLSVIRFDTIDEAFDINNEVPYGLSSSIYTQDVTASFRAVEELDNGITYVNAPTIGAEAHLPFGGVKNTGNGHREGGWEVYEFYTETKVAYVDYSGTLQRAQIDVDW
jgi:aldehyde dehydrogenase (NAD+)